MRPTKRFVRDQPPAGREDPSAQRLSSSKGRYTSAPPTTLEADPLDTEDTEIQVGDFTLVVKGKAQTPDASSTDRSKYSDRPTVGYGEAPGQTAEEKAASVVVIEEDDQAVPDWGEWVTERIITEVRYYRRDSRLFEDA